MISGLYVHNRDIMAVERQGILNREFLSLCYERSRKRCARNMWWLVTGSFLGSSCARIIWYCARSRRTEDFIRSWHDGVMGVIWRYSYVVVRSSNKDSDGIIVRMLKDKLCTQYWGGVSVVYGSAHIVSIWKMVFCTLYQESWRSSHIYLSVCVLLDITYVEPVASF